MKKYIISTIHRVFVDSYNEGEQEYANGYDIKSNVNAENVREAIEKYFESTLYYKFNFKDAYIDDENKNTLHYSVLVDDENNEASEEEIALWREEKKRLYSNNIILTVSELIEVEI
jgi:hypothetical protein